MHSLISRIKRLYLLLRAIPKTVLFNSYYFGVTGIRTVPVLVSHRVKLRRLGGKVTVVQPVPRAGIRIGFGHVGIFDQDRSRTIWENEGHVVFVGRARIGHGSKISVGPCGELILGDQLRMTAESVIRCGHRIAIGDSCLISWDVLIMDQDFHSMFDESGARTNGDQAITIGEHVWIGCRSLILKGTEIPRGSVIGAGSVVCRAFAGANQLIAGHPAASLRTGIRWQLADAVPGGRHPQ